MAIMVGVCAPTVAAAGARVEISSPRTKWARDAAKLSVTFEFDVTFKSKVSRTEMLTVRGSCLVDGKRQVDMGHVLQLLDEFQVGDSARVDAIVFNPMGANVLRSTPKECEFTVRLGRIGASPSPIATFCWREDESGAVIADGRCLSTEEVRRNEVKAQRDAFNTAARGCSAGTASMCHDLGRMHLTGIGTSKDLAKAEKVLMKTCRSAGSAGAASCAALHELAASLESTGVRDPQRLVRLYELACGADVVDACLTVGATYRDGFTKDAAKSTDAFERACKAKSASGCTQLLAFAQGTDASGDAIRERVCAAQGVSGCTSLGLARLARGELEAAEQDLAPACTPPVDRAACNGLLQLAAKYAEDSPAANPARAVSVLIRVCDAAIAEACNSLAMRLARGQGTPIDLVRAEHLAGLTCGATSTAGCAALAVVAKAYADGRAGQRDPEKARALFQRGCDAGDRAACTMAYESTQATAPSDGRWTSTGQQDHPAKSKPFYKNGWFWGVVAVVGAGAVLYATRGLPPDSSSSAPASALGDYNVPRLAW